MYFVFGKHLNTSFYTGMLLFFLIQHLFQINTEVMVCTICSMEHITANTQILALTTVHHLQYVQYTQQITAV